ncbi:MAG: hypothetical protein AMXMBFR47_01350 [Planctomycetota bacterium]
MKLTWTVPPGRTLNGAAGSVICNKDSPGAVPPADEPPPAPAPAFVVVPTEVMVSVDGGGTLGIVRPSLPPSSGGGA